MWASPPPDGRHLSWQRLLERAAGLGGGAQRDGLHYCCSCLLGNPPVSTVAGLTNNPVVAGEGGSARMAQIMCRSRGLRTPLAKWPRRRRRGDYSWVTLACGCSPRSRDCHGAGGAIDAQSVPIRPLHVKQP